MIAQLSGKIISKTPTCSVIDCHGVGYEVFHTPFCAERMPGPQITLLIHTVVREDAFQLFGFASAEEKSLFRELLRVGGIGPKMAHSILCGIPHEELISAIAAKNTTRLQKIPGIGKKTAERLALELADRLSQLKRGTSGGDLAVQSKESELESVLLNLGYQRSEVLRAIKTVRGAQSEFEEIPLEGLVKSSLRELTQGRPV